MADTRTDAVTKPSIRERNDVVGGTIIGSHGIDHMYGHGFLVILPELYTGLDLSPFQAGLIGAVRRGVSGILSMFSGLLVDMFPHHRGLLLGISLLLVGSGYLLTTWVPIYGVILIGLSVAAGGSALWHPPALSVLAQRFPLRRGFTISLHRSSGSIGDTLAPVIVGALLLTFTWQQIIRGAFPIPIFLTVLVLVILWKVGGPKVAHENLGSNLGRQLKSLRSGLVGTGLISLIAVSGMRGIADRTLLFFLPLYLAEDLDMGSLGIGFHLALLTALAIIFGPIIGHLSDRVGRKPVIIAVMAVSIIAPLFILWSGDTILLTVTIALLGVVMFSVNSLVQAAAMDIASGRRLEGSFIGLLWGGNAFFGALSPLLVGFLASHYGFSVIFYYAAACYVLGTFVSFLVPNTGGVRQQPTAA